MIKRDNGYDLWHCGCSVSLSLASHCCTSPFDILPPQRGALGAARGSQGVASALWDAVGLGREDGRRAMVSVLCQAMVLTA